MTNTRELAQKLLKGCEGVTPGPWRSTPYSSIVGCPITAQPDPRKNSVQVAGVRSAVAEDEIGFRAEVTANGRHIANCDPASIRTLATAHLTLLDEVERLKEAAKSLEDVLCDPEGNASIVGINGDMAVINAALSAFRRI